MKRIISLLFVAIFMLTLCGCEKELTADLNTVMADINEQFAFENMNEIESKEELSQYYLVEKEEVNTFAAESSTGKSYTTEIIFVEAVDEESAQNVAKVLNNYYRTRVDMANTYDANFAFILSSCSVKTQGRYVSLVTSDKSAEIEEVYNSYFE